MVSFSFPAKSNFFKVVFIINFLFGVSTYKKSFFCGGLGWFSFQFTLGVSSSLLSPLDIYMNILFQYLAKYRALLTLNGNHVMLATLLL